MKIWAKFFFIVGFPTLFLCSCATAGRDLHPDLAALKLGQLSISDCKKMLGRPNTDSDKTTSAGDFDILNYHYIANVWGSVKTRVLILEFKNGLLNGYVYVSSFKKDKTGGDPSKSDQVRAGIGKLGRDDVMRIMGQPDGKALAHTTLGDYKDQKDEGAEIWAWFEIDPVKIPFFGSSNETSSYLYVIFDDAGKVKDVQKQTSKDEVHAN